VPDRLAPARNRVAAERLSAPARHASPSLAPREAGPSALAVEAARTGQLVADPASEGDVLALQRTAGNRAVAASLAGQPAPAAARLSVARRPGRIAQRRIASARGLTPRRATSRPRTAQRAPAAAPAGGGAIKGAAAPTGAAPTARAEMADFVNGIQELVVSAVEHGGKTLYAVKFGPDASPAHLKILERVRRVLIKGQGTADAQGAARAEWPGLLAKIEAELEMARSAGLRGNQVGAIQDNLALVGDRYLHVRHKGPAEAPNADDYLDLVVGIRDLVDVTNKSWTDRTTGIVELNLDEMDAKQRVALTAVKFGPKMSSRHRKLLEGLRATLILARTPGGATAALAKWNSITVDLRYVLDQSANFVTGGAEVRADLAKLSQELIHGGAYTEAHQAVLKDVNLTSPDEAYQIHDLKEAVKEAEEASKLADKAFEMTGKAALDELFKHEEYAKVGPAIWELVKSPGEIKEAIEKFREKSALGKVATIGEIADKVRAFATSLAKVSVVAMRQFAEGAVELALKSGAFQKAVRWMKVSRWAAEKIEVLEKIENAKIFNKVKILTVVTVVISAIKIADYISKGQWGKALEEVATTSISLAVGALAPGLAGTAMVSGIAVVIWAEAEALSGAAAMIQYCKKANIREAAGDFVSTCMGEWNGGAAHFVADAKMLDAAQVVERPIIEKNLNSYAPYWLRAMDDLGAQMRSDRVNKLGGQPALRKALGPEALKILNTPGSWAGNWQRMAEQLQVMFSAANELGKYVEANYPKRESTEGASE
jgi:hypothetical protein